MTVDIKKLAALAKLSITDGNLPDEATITKQIADMINDLSLPPIPETSAELSEEDVMVLRKDEPQEPLPRELVLENAPQKQAGCFVVPKTV